MIRAATNDEVSELEKQGYTLGWRDGLMSREEAMPFSPRSIQARKYREGHKAGQAHREFLRARGMRYVSRLVEKSDDGWRWTVVVEEQLAEAGCEGTRKAAEAQAESAAIDNAFSGNAG